MHNTFFLLRHGKTKVDREISISEWELSPEGEEQAKRLADEGIFSEIDVVISSTETKAYQTAKPIADRVGKEIIQIKELSELDRDTGKFMQAEEYEKAVKNCLEHPDQSVNNWETVSHALQRFSKKIDELDKEYENKKILVVGHGFTINAYFAKLLGTSNVYERLSTNNFADWGVIKNHKVIKDISKSS